MLSQKSIIKLFIGLTLRVMLVLSENGLGNIGLIIWDKNKEAHLVFLTIILVKQKHIN